MVVIKMAACRLAPMCLTMVTRTILINRQSRFISSLCKLTSNPNLFQSQKTDSSTQFFMCKREYATKKAKKGKGAKTVQTVNLDEEDLEGIFNKEEFELEMKGVQETLGEQFIQQLALRTSPGVFNNLMVSTPEGRFPLNRLGQIVMKNPHLILVNLSTSPQYVSHVKESVMKSGLNINPQIEGSTIFLPLPKVTKAHREELAKNAKNMAENAKIRVRNIHNKYVKELKKMSDQHSSDLLHDLQQFVLQMMQTTNENIDKMTQAKQKELLEVK